MNANIMKTQFFIKLYMTWNVTFMLWRSFVIYFKYFWPNYNWLTFLWTTFVLVFSINQSIYGQLKKRFIIKLQKRCNRVFTKRWRKQTLAEMWLFLSYLYGIKFLNKFLKAKNPPHATRILTSPHQIRC